MTVLFCKFKYQVSFEFKHELVDSVNKIYFMLNIRIKGAELTRDTETFGSMVTTRSYLGTLRPRQESPGC